MARNHINKAYVSDADKFLHRIKRECGNTDSQQTEINRHKLIAWLRDNPEKEDQPDKQVAWKEF